ncbi:MAG TPA: hypothetical protein VGB87_12350 [Vicinamibacteria bacterium]
MSPAAPLLLFLPALLAGGPASAQQYGQWSWEGALGGTARSYRNSLDLAPTLSDDELGAELALGLNGFLGHPAVGRFGLLGTAGLIDYQGVRSLDSRRWGANSNLSLLPQSRFPLTLYASRQAYRYSQITQDDPLYLSGIPETSLGLGGRFRMRAGPLNGTLLGYDRSNVTYREAEDASALQETAFADWSRGGRTFDQHLRLAHQRQDFGLVDYSIRDLTGNFDQVARLGGGWRWELFAYGVRRELDYAGVRSQLDNARTSQRFIDVMSPRATLELSYDGGLSRGEDADFQSHTGLARLQLRPSPEWTFTPYGGYGIQIAGGTRLRAPQAGLSAAWARAKGALDVVVTEGVGVAWLQVEGGPQDTSLSLSVGATVGHGEERGLRKEVEASWARNQLRRAGDPIEGLPDLGIGLAGVGTEDSLRGRLTLRRRIGTSASLYGYGEASRRELSGTVGAAAPSVDTLTGTLQIAGRRASAAANVGTSRVGAPSTQEVRFWAATLTLRPLRRLSLAASYRADRRDLVLSPDVDAERVEASADLAVGAFVLTGQGFQTTETPRDGPERRNRGLVVTLSRRFGGWLPIVTGPPDGGVIR